MSILELAKQYSAPAAKYPALRALPKIDDIEPWQLLLVYGSSKIDGMFVPEKQLVCLSTEIQSNETLRTAVLLHELTHWCQYLRNGHVLTYDWESVVPNEFEAFCAQRAYMRDHNYVERREHCVDLVNMDDETLKAWIDKRYGQFFGRS